MYTKSAAGWLVAGASFNAPFGMLGESACIFGHADDQICAT